MYFGIHGMGTAVVLFCIRGRSAFIRAKSPARCNAYLAERDLQTRISSISCKPKMLMCFLGIYALSFAALVPRPVKGLEVVCLDVGQGDGLLLRSGKRAVLIDGGSSSQKNWGILCWSLIKKPGNIVD